MTNTKHLDTAIAIFKGNAGSKRAPRKAQAEVVVLLGETSYVITVNSKTVEAGEGDETHARQRADLRAEAIRKLGKTATVTVY